jgi:Ca2+-binding EF-hand superfamily protein
MKTTYTLAILTTLAAGGVAFAHGPGGKLERLDANKDGKVTLAEMKSEAAQKFKAIDADKNGRVVEAELSAHHEQMRAKFAEQRAARGDGAGKADGDCHGKKMRHRGKAFFLKKMDANNDGAIDAAEWTGHVEQRFARMDDNGDKVLAGAELERRHGWHGRGKHRDERRGPAGAGAAGGAAK